MTDLVRINDEVITSDDFVKQLKLNARFNELIEEIVAEKIFVHAGRQQGIEPTTEETQSRADQIRRVIGLHRAADMNRWLDQLAITLDDLESFIVESLIFEAMQEEVVNDETIANYFKLNSPKYDCLLLSHIVIDSEGKARELMAILEDEPDMFEELAREHSLADTRAEGGYIGRVTRGSMVNDVEAKVFNADPGQVLGPFSAMNEDLFEIFQVNDRRGAELDSTTESEIRRSLREEWLHTQTQEFIVEMCG